MRLVVGLFLFFADLWLGSSESSTWSWENPPTALRYLPSMWTMWRTSSNCKLIKLTSGGGGWEWETMIYHRCWRSTAHEQQRRPTDRVIADRGRSLLKHLIGLIPTFPTPVTDWLTCSVTQCSTPIRHRSCWTNTLCDGESSRVVLIGARLLQPLTLSPGYDRPTDRYMLDGGGGGDWVHDLIVLERRFLSINYIELSGGP